MSMHKLRAPTQFFTQFMLKQSSAHTHTNIHTHTHTYIHRYNSFIMKCVCALAPGGKTPCAPTERRTSTETGAPNRYLASRASKLKRCAVLFHRALVAEQLGQIAPFLCALMRMRVCIIIRCEDAGCVCVCVETAQPHVRRDADHKRRTLACGFLFSSRPFFFFVCVLASPRVTVSHVRAVCAIRVA